MWLKISPTIFQLLNMIQMLEQFYSITAAGCSNSTINLLGRPISLKFMHMKIALDFHWLHFIILQFHQISCTIQ